ncbi:MAG: cell division protein ZapB [Gemmatimonadetes bacterium]|nr:cell division protein ZapB [Gemmatimonadota bacterium]
MDLELLDRLEDRVDVAVSTVRDLKMENELLKEETSELQTKVEALTKELAAVAEQKGDADKLRQQCGELEKKLDRVRGRIESMVDKMKALEG